MHITLINTPKSNVDKMYEPKILWSTILFAERINWATSQSYLTLFRYVINVMEERYRINTYKSFLPIWKIEPTPEKLEDDYQFYLKTKKRKHKTLADLKFLRSWGKFIKSLENILMDYIKQNEKILGVTELSSFMNRPGKGIISLYYISEFIHEIGVQDTEIDAVLTTLYSEYEIHAFCEMIEEHLNFKTFNSNVRKDFFKKNKFSALREKFIEVTAPESLTYNQVAIIRNELTEKFKEVMNSIEEFNKELREKKLSVENINEIKKRYIDKIKTHLSEIQKAVDNNIYMNQLKNKEDEPKVYKLYLVLTTMQNIVGLYEKLNIISKSSALYCRDELQQKGVLDALKFFVYLKEEGG
ncbi:MAG: hypothetical protein H8D45_19275 [Bacteroidetes bacterium]|nr:hypothetical protein [Bacteroidota bacterium]